MIDDDFKYHSKGIPESRECGPQMIGGVRSMKGVAVYLKFVTGPFKLSSAAVIFY